MHFFEKKSAKSLPVQKLLVPLQPQISREAFAQMAESVDALVSNTSGAIHPGSIPGLGTKSCKSKDLWLFLSHRFHRLHRYFSTPKLKSV